MKNKNENQASLTGILMLLFLVFISFETLAQRIHSLEPVSQHYKTFALLHSQPNATRASLDTIQFPWTEYSKGALTNSLMRSYYLSAEGEAVLLTLIKCPSNSSDETRADLDYLLQLQSKRTKSDTTRAQYIANIGSWPNILNPTDPDYIENRNQLFYIASSIGPWFNPENFPATTQLLMNCIQDIRATEFRLKRHFKRPRPYHLEPKLQPLARINSPSFASGHSLWAFSEAFLFAELIPEKRGDFIAKAEEVRWSREVLGIHYPSDNEASRIISWNLVNDWFKNPQFIADFEKAKKEWKLTAPQYLTTKR